MPARQDQGDGARLGPCQHAAALCPVPPHAGGCQPCLDRGDTWVRLHWRSVMSRFCGMAACSDWLAVTSCSPRRGRVRAVRLLFRLRFVMLTRAGGALRLLFAVSRVAAAVLRCPGMPGSRRGGAGPGWRVAGGQTAGGAFGCASGVPAGSGSRCSRVAAGTACLLLRVLTFLMV